MNVLVTGGAGFIGSHTCVELLESGYGVVVVDNLCNSNPESLRRVQELTGKTLKFYEGDVRDEALLEKIFQENEIGCVIHFAGLKAVGESVSLPWKYYDNNLNSTLVLTKVMEKVGMKKLIFSSSATVYTADNEMPLQETSRYVRNIFLVFVLSAVTAAVPMRLYVGKKGSLVLLVALVGAVLCFFSRDISSFAGDLFLCFLSAVAIIGEVLAILDVMGEEDDDEV